MATLSYFNKVTKSNSVMKSGKNLMRRFFLVKRKPTNILRKHIGIMGNEYKLVFRLIMIIAFDYSYIICEVLIGMRSLL